MSEHQDILDWHEACRRIPGGDEMVRELADLLLSECPVLLDQVRSGMASDDAKAVAVAAHTLKGSADVFTATRVVEAARQLETMGRSGDLGGGNEALAVLEREVEQLVDALNSLTKS